jgi:hypothetical protein
MEFSDEVRRIGGIGGVGKGIVAGNPGLGIYRRFASLMNFLLVAVEILASF